MKEQPAGNSRASWWRREEEEDLRKLRLNKKNDFDFFFFSLPLSSRFFHSFFFLLFFSFSFFTSSSSFFQKTRHYIQRANNIDTKRPTGLARTRAWPEEQKTKNKQTKQKNKRQIRARGPPLCPAPWRRSSVSWASSDQEAAASLGPGLGTALASWTALGCSSPQVEDGCSVVPQWTSQATEAVSHQSGWGWSCQCASPQAAASAFESLWEKKKRREEEHRKNPINEPGIFQKTTKTKQKVNENVMKWEVQSKKKKGKSKLNQSWIKGSSGRGKNKRADRKGGQEKKEKKENEMEKKELNLRKKRMAKVTNMTTTFTTTCRMKRKICVSLLPAIPYSLKVTTGAIWLESCVAGW